MKPKKIFIEKEFNFLINVYPWKNNTCILEFNDPTCEHEIFLKFEIVQTVVVSLEILQVKYLSCETRLNSYCKVTLTNINKNKFDFNVKRKIIRNVNF